MTWLVERRRCSVVVAVGLNVPACAATSTVARQELYDFAEQLIRQGDAYVCAQSQADCKASRELLKQFHIDCGA